MKNSNEILIASSNQGKVKEFKKLFQDHKIFSLSDFDIEDAIENGSSFFENALIKAKHGSLYSEKFTIADDSGLVVPDLNFEPGIYSARYAGEGSSDKENRDHLINKLNLIKKEELDAYYVCVLVGLRSVIVEFDTYETALAAYNSASYQKAIMELDGTLKRDFRIIRGTD